MLIAIYAEDLNHIIGYQNKMPWHIPKDLAFFKEQTLEHTVVMGYNTFKSLNYQKLPNRKNIVLTKKHYQSSNDPNLIFYQSISNFYKDYYQNNDQKYYIIGGKEIFNLFIDDVDWIYRTKIEANFIGDTKMDEINNLNFQLTKQIFCPLSNENNYSLIFEFWKNNKKD